MAKLVELNKKYWTREDYGHWCPGCNTGHEISVNQANHSGARWTFDGNFQQPTFSPSINYRWGKFAKESDTDAGGVCHYFIRAGKIEFCSDTTHAFAGQTVDLPDIPPYAYTSCKRL